MSINYKRMSVLIKQEVSKIPELSVSQSEQLAKLTNKIYLIESTQSNSPSKMTEEIMSEISFASGLWKQ